MNEINEMVGKKLPYDVPKNYFEMQRKELLKIAEGKEASMKASTMRKWMSVAAIVAIVFVGAGTWFWASSRGNMANNQEVTTNIYYMDEDVSEEALLELAEADIFLNEI